MYSVAEFEAVVSGRPVAWEPQPRQEVALRCPADERFFGGAKGGGKTDAALGDWLLQMVLAKMKTEEVFKRTSVKRRIRSSGVLFRRTYKELDQVIKRSKQIFPLLGGRWKEADKTWIFPYGTLLLRYLDKDSDAMAYQGHQYDWICFDELGNYGTPFCYNQMLSCLRSPDGIKARMLSTGNPGGPGQGWIKRRFISGCTPDHIHTYKNKVIVKGEIIEVEMTRCFIPSSVSDNRFWSENDPGYLARLAALPEAQRRAFLDGDWDVAMGQAFGDFGSQHIVAPFSVPGYWKRFATMDWGYAKPFSLGLWAVSPIGRLYRIGEYYGCVPGLEDEGLRMNAKLAARKFVEITNAMGIDKTYADPACWQTHGHGKTIANIMTNAGLNVLPADRNRESSKATFHSMMQTELDDGFPAFQVFDNCAGWLRTVPNLVTSKTNVEDVDTTGEDHPYDDTRFALLSPEVVELDYENQRSHTGHREEKDYAS